MKKKNTERKTYMRGMVSMKFFSKLLLKVKKDDFTDACVTLRSVVDETEVVVVISGAVGGCCGCCRLSFLVLNDLKKLGFAMLLLVLVSCTVWGSSSSYLLASKNASGSSSYGGSR